MSIVAMKNKSVIKHGSKRSGVPPGGYWMPQGPFGGGKPAQLDLSIRNYGPVGFSLAGTHRNVGYVGQSMGMSKSGTPFRGMNPIGNGGCCGKYAQPLPVYNVNQVIVQGDQNMYVKPSVLGQRGMLRKKFRYIYNGQYPNYIVKEVYSGDKTDNAFQGVYLSKVTAANTCVDDVNDVAKYEDDIAPCGPPGCRPNPATAKYNTIAAQGRFTKMIKQPLDSSTYTTKIQRPCANPLPSQRPQPVPDNGNGRPCAAAISNTLL